MYGITWLNPMSLYIQCIIVGMRGRNITVLIVVLHISTHIIFHCLHAHLTLCITTRHCTFLVHSLHRRFPVKTSPTTINLIMTFTRHRSTFCFYCDTRIFDPRATRVKNPFTQIQYELFFTMIFMNFVCLTLRY
jgi:hypothetical protein